MKTLYILGVGALGLYLSMAGTFFYLVGVPYIVNDQIRQRVSLHNGSEVYPVWRHMDFLEFNAYVFNITNPDDVVAGKKPVVQEIGPFCYKLHRLKDELEVDEKEDTVLFVERRHFFPTMSNTDKKCRSHDLPLTVLNVPLVATVQILLEIAPDLVGTFGDAVPMLFPGITDPFLRVQAKDLLFDGVKLDCSQEDFTLGMVCKTMKDMAPPQLQLAPNGVDYNFALLNWMNDTREGPFRIYRGTENVSNTGIFVGWRNKDHLEYWKSEECNEFKGPDCYLLGPLLDHQKHLDIFSPDLCRAVRLDLTEEVEIHGLVARHFVAQEGTMGENERNKCFCPNKKNEEGKEEMVCLKGGVINLSPCLNKAPVVFSWPHFYLGAEEYIHSVEGLNPEYEKHKTDLYVAPLFGAPVTGSKRAQVNIFTEKNDDIEMLNNIYEGIIPIMWIEEGAIIPGDFRFLLKAVVILLKLLDLMFFGMIAGGILCLFAFVALCIFNKKDPENDDPPSFPFEYKPQNGFGSTPNSNMPIPYNMPPKISTISNQNHNMPNQAMVEQFNAINRLHQAPPAFDDFNRNPRNVIIPTGNRFLPQNPAGSFYE